MHHDPGRRRRPHSDADEPREPQGTDQPLRGDGRGARGQGVRSEHDDLSSPEMTYPTTARPRLSTDCGVLRTAEQDDTKPRCGRALRRPTCQRPPRQSISRDHRRGLGGALDQNRYPGRALQPARRPGRPRVRVALGRLRHPARVAPHLSPVRSQPGSGPCGRAGEGRAVDQRSAERLRAPDSHVGRTAARAVLFPAMRYTVATPSSMA